MEALRVERRQTLGWRSEKVELAGRTAKGEPERRGNQSPGGLQVPLDYSKG